MGGESERASHNLCHFIDSHNTGKYSTENARGEQRTCGGSELFSHFIALHKLLHKCFPRPRAAAAVASSAKWIPKILLSPPAWHGSSLECFTCQHHPVWAPGSALPAPVPGFVGDFLTVSDSSKSRKAERRGRRGKKTHTEPASTVHSLHSNPIVGFILASTNFPLFSDSLFAIPYPISWRGNWPHFLDHKAIKQFLV